MNRNERLAPVNKCKHHLDENEHVSAIPYSRTFQETPKVKKTQSL